MARGFAKSICKHCNRVQTLAVFVFRMTPCVAGVEVSVVGRDLAEADTRGRHVSQVDAIVSTAEPYAASAKKRARRLSLAAGELMNRRVSFGAVAKPHRR